MDKVRAVIAVAALVVSSSASAKVNVFIGTSGVGHASPAATYPFGMLQAGPDTSATADGYVGDWKHCSGYQYTDPWVWRFSQTHVSGPGVGSAGDLGILPYVEEPKDGKYVARMVKRSERAEPGLYSVLFENGIQTDIAAAERAVAYHILYPRGSVRKLLVDSDWGVMNVDTNRQNCFGRRTTNVWMDFPTQQRIVGCFQQLQFTDYSVSFVIDFDEPFVTRNEVRKAGNGHGATWSLEFAGHRALNFRVAISVISSDQAIANLNSEPGGYDAYRRRSTAAWAKQLARVHLEAEPAIKESFEVAYYRCCFQPNLRSDVNAPRRYANFSLWDTFRAAHPLYTLVAPERVDDFILSLYDQYRRQGYLPIISFWGGETHCMIGKHSVPVIVDAFLKRDKQARVMGVGGVDWKEIYAAVRNSLTKGHSPKGNGTWALLKEDWDILDHYGYYPFDKLRGRGHWYGQVLRGESVSRTLEQAYDDECAARFAEELGYAEDAAFFRKRAGYWRNVIDPETGFARGRDAEGNWRTPFDPKDCGAGPWADNDFTEGNSWQYTWHVMHDVEGLVEALGGREKALAKLEALFNESSEVYGKSFTHDVSGLIGQYAHGNEPSHHVIYLFSLLGRPDLAGKYIRKVFEKMYTTSADGLCGNDDCGQMAAWYVFSALGFYPVDPCGGEYVIGAPQVKSATLFLPGAHKLQVQVENYSPRATEVESVIVNGITVTNAVIRHADLMRGGYIRFKMKPPAPTERRLLLAEFRDRMEAAWIGQMAGVAWGAPTEFGYVDRIIPEEKMPKWKPEMINDAFGQDDLYVEMTFLRTLERRGVNVTMNQAGIDFANSRYSLWCANREGRENLRRGIAPPDCSHPAFHARPNDIDYQIESDFSGIISPGCPQGAIDLSHKFGRLMNYGDGVWAGAFVGGMYAEAYYETNLVKIVEAGLKCIPEQSDYAKIVRSLLEDYAHNPSDWQTAWSNVVAKCRRDPRYQRDSNGAIDVRINGAMVVLGILWGNGDLDETIRIACRGGYDSDCNPSSAAGVVFTTVGAKRLPERFTKALVRSGRKFRFTDYDFNGLLAASEKAAVQILESHGGRLIAIDGQKDDWLVAKVAEPVRDQYRPSWMALPPTGSRFSEEEITNIVEKASDDNHAHSGCDLLKGAHDFVIAPGEQVRLDLGREQLQWMCPRFRATLSAEGGDANADLYVNGEFFASFAISGGTARDFTVSLSPLLPKGGWCQFCVNLELVLRGRGSAAASVKVHKVRMLGN